MLVKRILKLILLLLAASFVVLQGLAYEVEAAAISAATLVCLTILYTLWTETKSQYFFWFLLTFTVGHVLSYVSYYAVDFREAQTDFHTWCGYG